MHNKENSTKKETTGLNVPRTKLIELAFDEDESFISPEDDEELIRQRWLSTEQCHHQTQHI